MIPTIYPITDRELSYSRNVLKDIEDLCYTGAKIIQLREKNLSIIEYYQLAKQAIKITKHYGCKLIINDKLEIAISVNADGLHIGQDDISIEKVNKYFSKKTVGITVHNLEEAKKAEKQGASYLGVSPIFNTKTKKDAGKTAGINLITKIRRNINIPLVAIGGIKENNMSSCFYAGADSVAMISEIITKPDIKNYFPNLLIKANEYKKQFSY